MLVLVLIFLVVLSVLILVHEFGHFIMARKFKIPVLEFGFGLPPRIFGKQIKGTIYSINAIPFGGFVRLFGENGEEESEDLPRKLAESKAFINKSKKVRTTVILAGVVMNFLLGVAAFAVVYSFSGIPRDTHKLKVVEISTGSPAQSAGFIVGDIITKVGKVEVSSVDGFVAKVNDQKGKTVVFEVERSTNGQVQEVEISAKPRENPPQGEGPLGVTITTTEIYFPPVWQRPFYGIYYGFKEALFWGKNIAGGLWEIVTQLFKGHAPVGVAGPVGIFVVTTEAAKNGLMTLINFVGILSVNLAILNITPFPALDGGRLLFIGIESVFGKKVLPKIEATIHTIGFIILISLIVLITIGDVRRLIVNGGIDGFLKSMAK